MGSFVLSRIDYASSILVGLPDVLLNKLFAVQNNAAHLVMKEGKSDHVILLFKYLNRLPCRWRIEYKILLLTVKALLGLAPVYIHL